MTQQDMTQQQPAFFTSPAQMIQIAQQQQQEQQPFRTTGAQIKQIARNRPEELIKGFVPSSGVMVLAGAPGTGKSFTALSWAAAIAEGSQWFGKAARQAPVVYVLGEGYSCFGDRVEAWETVNGREIPEDLTYVNGLTFRIDLKDPYSVQKLIERINEVPTGLVIFDTFSVLARVTNENDNSEVAQVMANAHTIAEATGATVMLIHHVTKSTGSVRGASAFVGNADTVVVATEEKKKNENGEIETDGFLLSTASHYGGKRRDGEPKTMHGFSIATPGVLTHGSNSKGNSSTTQTDPNSEEMKQRLIATAMAGNKRLEEQDS